jgi:hypothetical protein
LESLSREPRTLAYLTQPRSDPKSQIRDGDDRRWPDVIEARHWWVFLLASILWLAVCYWLAARSLRRGEDVVDVALAVNMSTGLIFLAGAMFDRWRSPRSGG